MYMMARIYPSQEQAQAAVDALLAAGYGADIIAMITAPGAAAPRYADAPEMAESAASQAADVSSAEVATSAMRAGSMMGRRADFYMSHLEPGNSLVVATPSYIECRVAETILDAHGPLPISHEPPRKAFVPISQQATPLSDFLGIAPLTRSAPVFSEALGLSTVSEGTTHLSRWFAPLADGWTLSSKIGLSTKSRRDTPLSSMLKLKLSSDRLAGKSSSFGFPLKTKSGTPLSSMLRLRMLAKTDRYLYKDRFLHD